MDALDSLLGAVDDRNRQFYDAAVRKIELMLNAGTSTSGQLHQLLGAFTSGRADPGAFPQLHDRFILELLEAKSLASPTREGRAFVPSLVERTEPDPVAVEDARHRSTRQIRLALRFSRERVKRFAMSLLADRPICKASDIEALGPEDLPMLIYLRRYGDGSLGYVIEKPGQSAWIVRDGVGFEDFVIKRAKA